MDHFQHKNNKLHAEEVSLEEIAQQVGTPFYCYSSATFTRHFNVIRQAFSNDRLLICYAVKANSNIAILKLLANLGAGADIVTEGELRRALTAGIPAEKIVFSGVGKSDQEIAYALEQNIGQLNVESEAEWQKIAGIASSLGKTAPIALRLNPNVDAKTHAKISTGKAENKFGLPIERLEEYVSQIQKLPSLKLKGLAVHIGSQLTDLQPYRDAFSQLVEAVKRLKASGTEIETLDFGGGLGIPYDQEDPPPPIEWANMIAELTQGLDCGLIIEPGRVIAGNAGVLVTKILYTKQAGQKKFIILDAAMNDLMRPSLYDAYHRMVPVVEKPEAEIETVDIVGPVCETGDTFGTNRELQKSEAGEFIAIRSAGAYGAVMSSTYNSRLLIPEILVHEDQFAVIRKRQTFEELLGLDTLPDWM